MTPLKLSIVVPCYNASTTVDVTLRSITQQDLSEIEIVVVDDASTDETPLIIESWAKRDQRIRPIFLESNSGIGDVRNRAVRECQGKYVTFVDADDWVRHSYHQSLVSAAEHLQVDFVKSDYVRVRGTERTIMHAPSVPRGRAIASQHGIAELGRATMVDYPFVWCGVFRRSFLFEGGADFGTGLHTAEDRIFTWKCHLYASSYACIQECGYLHRKEGGSSLTSIGDIRQLDFLRCIEQIFELLGTNDASEALWMKAYRQAISLIIFHYDRRHRFLPAVWSMYCQWTRSVLNNMNQHRLESVCSAAGERRTRIIKNLMLGTIGAPGADRSL